MYENEHMKTKLLKIGLPLMVTIALAFGVYSWFTKPSSAQQKLAEGVKQTDAVFEQYFNADYETSKDAMLKHIQFLDRFSAESDRPTRNPYAVDAMNWCVRMAKLEEMNHRDGMEFIEQARSRCEKLGWADCSIEKLQSEVERMDKIAFAQLKKN
jgi:hypothetical protein